METRMVKCPECGSDTPVPANVGYFDWGYTDANISEPRIFHCIWCGKEFAGVCERGCVGVEVVA